VFRFVVIVPCFGTKFEGASEEDILEQVAVHSREEHGMDDVPPDVVDNVRARITEA